MTRTFRIALVAVAFALTLPALSAQPAVADEQPGKSGNHSKKSGEADRGRSQSQNRGHEGGRSDGPYMSADGNFSDDVRRAIRAYFGDEVKRGRCPPGLAKKNNGCMPPGQAKKWSIGQRLPTDVIFHAIPRDLAARIARPPQGYRYVRVDSDILMITTGIGMVVAAVENMGLL